MQTSIIGRAVALVAGIISAAGGLALLLDDVVKGAAPFEVKHGITIGIVALAILAGHSVTNAWREHSAFGVVGFLIVFLAATGLVVVKSTGRQAEHTFASQAEADFAAEERARIKPKLIEAEAMHSASLKKVDADCVNGRKSRGHCDGLRATLAVYEAAIKGHKADLDRLGPPRPVAPEAENLAGIAAAFGADKGKVKAATVLALPFLTTALFEFGAIVGFFFAFRQRNTATVARHLETVTANGEEEGKGGNGFQRPIPPRPDLPSNPGKRVYTRAEALLDVTRRLASRETIPSQETLAEAWGVHPGTASKWLRKWREDGLVPTAQRVGRCHRLVAAD